MACSRKYLACFLTLVFSFFSRDSFSKDHGSTQSHGFYEKCGISLSFPKILDSVVNYQINPCLDSYIGKNGATLPLGMFLGGGQNPSALENLPMLHIYRRNLDIAMASSNGSGIRGTEKGVVSSTTSSVERECGLSRRTTISKIRGSNWRGWIAEDFYKKNTSFESPPEYCETFDEKNRCIRLIIGNNKETITMAQYCFVRRHEDFDLDAGLSYGIFMEVVNSIKLLDE